MQPPPNADQNYLHPKVSRLLENVTGYVSKPLGFHNVVDVNDKQRKEIEYASSLPLQMAVYFNVYYSIAWFLGSCFLFPILISRSYEIYMILILLAFVLNAIFEFIRLYLGYLGNLCERVPELTGFWLLTLTQCLLCIFLLVIVWIPVTDCNVSECVIGKLLPMQFALEVIHSLFVFLETILGFFALRILARYQISRFHYKQFDDNVVRPEYEWKPSFQQNEYELNKWYKDEKEPTKMI